MINKILQIYNKLIHEKS